MERYQRFSRAGTAREECHRTLVQPAIEHCIEFGQTERDTIETDGVEQIVVLLDEPMIRDELTRTIHDARLTYLQKPISEIIGDVASSSKDPDAGRKLAHSTAPHIWEWIHAQLPVLVQRLDVQAMVERKVMAFSVDRVEEILRSVIDNELRLIIITGYVLGGLIGLGTFGVSRLLGL